MAAHVSKNPYIIIDMDAALGDRHGDVEASQGPDVEASIECGRNATLMIPNLFPSGRLMLFLFLWLDPSLAGSMPSSLPRATGRGHRKHLRKLLEGTKVCVL